MFSPVGKDNVNKFVNMHRSEIRNSQFRWQDISITWSGVAALRGHQAAALTFPHQGKWDFHYRLRQHLLLPPSLYFIDASCWHLNHIHRLPWKTYLPTTGVLHLLQSDEAASFALFDGGANVRDCKAWSDKTECREHVIRRSSPQATDKFFIADAPLQLKGSKIWTFQSPFQLRLQGRDEDRLCDIKQ